MNARLKELKLMALEKFASNHGLKLTHLGDLDPKSQEEVDALFAELIVRECIDIVKPTQHHEAWAQSYLGGVDGLELLDSRVEKIKQYFGVEE